jgi:hypothetical protein
MRELSDPRKHLSDPLDTITQKQNQRELDLLSSALFRPKATAIDRRYESKSLCHRERLEDLAGCLVSMYAYLLFTTYEHSRAASEIASSSHWLLQTTGECQRSPMISTECTTPRND